MGYMFRLDDPMIDMNQFQIASVKFLGPEHGFTSNERYHFQIDILSFQL